MYNLSGEPQRALDVLLSRNFVACEGGEHYIADEYMFAYYLLGKERYVRGDYEGVAEAFLSAQTLPQSLGSGLWNEAKLVPYRYFQAKCLFRLGRKKEAEEILRGFLKFRFDYFSDMYLLTLAYYVARVRESSPAPIPSCCMRNFSATEKGNRNTVPRFPPTATGCISKISRSESTEEPPSAPVFGQAEFFAERNLFFCVRYGIIRVLVQKEAQ